MWWDGYFSENGFSFELDVQVLLDNDKRCPLSYLSFSRGSCFKVSFLPGTSDLQIHTFLEKGSKKDPKLAEYWKLSNSLSWIKNMKRVNGKFSSGADELLGVALREMNTDFPGELIIAKKNAAQDPVWLDIRSDLCSVLTNGSSATRK